MGRVASRSIAPASTFRSRHYDASLLILVVALACLLADVLLVIDLLGSAFSAASLALVAAVFGVSTRRARRWHVDFCWMQLS